MEFGGNIWIIEPAEGTVFGLTSNEKPFLTLDIDLKQSEKSKHTYP